MSDRAVEIRFRVNGREAIVRSHPMARLLDVLRQDLRLTGTKEGCGEGECGACSVIVNGELANSCLLPVLQAEGASITTMAKRPSSRRACIATLPASTGVRPRGTRNSGSWKKAGTSLPERSRTGSP